ncbi:hypothetical protein DFH09DRAFT_1494528 [Mycena vulgaris]|nr:hypothetical protein DFH09DRAFT_1494528 [Mycena vulgaris]
MCDMGNAMGQPFGLGSKRILPPVILKAILQQLPRFAKAHETVIVVLDRVVALVVGVLVVSSDIWLGFGGGVEGGVNAPLEMERGKEAVGARGIPEWGCPKDTLPWSSGSAVRREIGKKAHALRTCTSGWVCLVKEIETGNLTPTIVSERSPDGVDAVTDPGRAGVFARNPALGRIKSHSSRCCGARHAAQITDGPVFNRLGSEDKWLQRRRTHLVLSLSRTFAVWLGLATPGI